MALPSSHPLLPSLLAAALLLLPACSDSDTPGNGGNGTSSASGDQRPVILISIDSLRADFVSVYGHKPKFAPDQATMPFLQELADNGVVFENASAASPWTLPSHMTLLTGMNPVEHGVRSRKFSLDKDIELVSDRFQQAGYKTGGFFSAPFLHPAWGFGRGFDVYMPSADYLGTIDAGNALSAAGKSDEVVEIHHQSHTDNETGAQVVDRALAWLEQDKNYEDPFFLFLHFWDPHYDYFPPTEYAEMFHPGYDGDMVGDELMKLDRPISPDEMDHLKALYEAEIRYTDDQIRRLFARLEELGIADDVIVAIVSDHGDEFEEHGNRGHHLTLLEEVMHVPMVISAPGVIDSAKRVEASVSIRDAAPTLMDLAGLPAWTDRSGLSLRPLWEDEDIHREVSLDLLRPAKRMQLVGYRHGMLKGIRDVPKRTFTVYDLVADPGELSPSVGAENADKPFTKAALGFFAIVADSRHQTGLVKETAEITNLLDQVGYAESEAPQYNPESEE
ncbi:MAG: sulfatase [Planctomycetes bacterium]|nr:sulfatase [Planctomycetota bacterium]MCP4770138.1 sulfatase [Planctomycetota bacterium]MCP4860714.1 sulfatase [Planctomycetota bacterium]